ncbi:MAG: ferredoxin [Aeromicrobium sp.]
MRISINSGRCQGHALCGGFIPEIVDYDDEGYARVDNPVVPAGSEVAAQQAESSCPEQAISLAD